VAHARFGIKRVTLAIAFGDSLPISNRRLVAVSYSCAGGHALKSRIIILNGVGSAGKSSIARALNHVHADTIKPQ
jgi:chloramphenicol 3-O-phosphotransferase